MKNEILPAVAVVVFNEDHEVLLQKRRDTGKWCIISGHVEFGESVEQAILREIKEETEASAEIVRFIGLYSSPEYQTYDYADHKIQYVTAYFEVVLKSKIPGDFSNNETVELKYFPIDALPETMDKINPHWLTDALSKKTEATVR
jgi:8-oxo-dGTP diphosphatase